MPASPSVPTQPPSPKAADAGSSSASPPVTPRTEQLVTYVRDCKSSGIPIEICYQCFGDPAAGLPVVLLVCGLNMQLLAWDETFCEDLVRAGFFVVRYDNRDIGHSTKVEHIGSVVGPRLLLSDKWASFFGERLPYSIESMARDGIALLDALGIDKAHVFGISMGGAIAQTIAILAPHRIMSLTSLMSSTNGSDLPDPQISVKLWMLRQPPKGCTIDELLDFRVNSLRHLLNHALPVDSVYLKKRYLMSLERSSYSAGLVRQAAALRRAASRDDALRSMTIPALVIHGAQDVVVPPVHGYRTAQCLPHARLLVFKSMGHYFHPAFFPAIVTAFSDMAATTRAVGGSPLHGRQLYHTLVPHPRTQAGVEPKFFPATAAHAEARDTRVTGDAVSPTTAAATVASQVVASLEGQMDVTNEQLMASIGPYLFPVVTSIYSKTGRAVCALVNTAVPISGTIPVPEAVLLDLHEPTPSLENAVMSTTTAMRRRPVNDAVDALGTDDSERGGVGRVQGIAIIAAKSCTTRSSKQPALTAPTASPPPPAPPAPGIVPEAPAPGGASSTSPTATPKPGPAASASPTSLTPTTTQLVAEKLTSWWGAVVGKASTAMGGATTAVTLTDNSRAATGTAPSAVPNTDRIAVPTATVNGNRNAAEASSLAVAAGAKTGTANAKEVKRETATTASRIAAPPSAAPDTVDIEDVVEPFVPGSPSTWNKARFPTNMSAAASTRSAATSHDAAAADRGCAERCGVVRLVGVPLSTHLQRLHEKEQRRRLVEAHERQTKLAARGTSSSAKSTPARVALHHKPVLSSPLADKGVKGMVSAPGVVNVVAKRPADGSSAGAAPCQPPITSVYISGTARNEEEEVEEYTTKDSHQRGTNINEELTMEAFGEAMHTRAASTYDIAATLLAPVLPTETDDMVISALPSPTEQEIECARMSLTLTP